MSFLQGVLNGVSSDVVWVHGARMGLDIWRNIETRFIQRTGSIVIRVYVQG